MNRKQKFFNYQDCPINRNAFKRLTKEELEQCIDFINENEHLTQAQFGEKVNRWHLGNPMKPKHHVDMWALVLSANSGKVDL